MASGTGQSISYNGITWNFSHTVVSGQYITGDPWVLANPNGGVELSSITPQCVLGTNAEDVHGSMTDLHWTNMTAPGSTGIKQGFHGSSTPNNNTAGPNGSNYDRDLNFALVDQGGGSYTPISASNRKILPVNTSLISCESSPVDYIYAPGSSSNRTQIRRQAILTCVSSVPVDGAFRPAFSLQGEKESLITSADLYGS